MPYVNNIQDQSLSFLDTCKCSKEWIQDNSMRRRRRIQLTQMCNIELIEIGWFVWVDMKQMDTASQRVQANHCLYPKSAPWHYRTHNQYSSSFLLQSIEAHLSFILHSILLVSLTCWVLMKGWASGRQERVVNEGRSIHRLISQRLPDITRELSALQKHLSPTIHSRNRLFDWRVNEALGNELTPNTIFWSEGRWWKERLVTNLNEYWFESRRRNNWSRGQSRYSIEWIKLTYHIDWTIFLEWITSYCNCD